MKWLSRPDIQMYITAVLVFFGGMLIVSHSVIDIHMHDTHGPFADKSYLWACLMIAAEALIYTFTLRFSQFRWLQVLHVASLLLFLLAYVTVESPPMPRRYFDYHDRPLIFSGRVFDPVTFFTTMLLVIGQAGFVINIIAGFIRGPKTSQAPGQPQPALQLYIIALLALAAGVACYFAPVLLPADLPVFPDIHEGFMFGMLVPVLSLWLAVIAFLVGQLAFIVNVIAGFCRGKKTTLS
ncbi:hypothetical protein ACFOTA_11895 [Chitinophaga sp. GCM10012297]|uniref:Integral membrane protein n=1 Tax=Chitinophaga chungangae TaxID=2821488 RepID=A0ABS3YE08_9BACT|nr:hypothetical protein [Chitinophaga chungangae]MBO9152912.1 hypothetical protein [Chitinophaga chungangae]